MNYTLATSLIFSLYSFTTPVCAEPRDIGEGLRNDTPAKILNNGGETYSRWSGIGLLKTPENTTCTATLIDTRQSGQKADGPAYLITSGHCAGAAIGSSTLNQSYGGTITFNYFHDTPGRHKTYKVGTTNWASLVGMDMAILEVEKSLASLILDGITPLNLAPPPALGPHDVLFVGAPGGLPEKGLRLSACSQELARTNIGHLQRFPGGFVNQCQGLQHGSSGGPILDRRTNKIISIISEAHYSFAASFLSPCFINGVFSSNASNCALQEVDIEIDLQTLFRTTVRSQLNAGLELLPTWDFRFEINTPYYRYKATRDALSCQDPNQYSAAISATDAYINSAIGPETRMHVLCIIGVNSAEQQLVSGLLRNVFTHAVHLAEPAPAPSITLDANRNAHLSWSNAYPAFTSHFFHAGPADITQCGDFDDARYQPVAGSLTLRITSATKVCSYAQGDSGPQPSAVRFDLIE
ncbi:trypsin-like peptidase domain-containing protein [Pseudomonas sp. NPDC098740]|uniref:trypsin-like peptidase domain-containing protein n=1 Tax=Pseudomonas sp. NPDC098740 TaxID=3364486 RepID=UPI00383A1B3F